MTDESDLIERCLIWAADAIGDITPGVMQLLYDRHPTAHAAFQRHLPGATLSSLQGSMVEQTIFCFLNYHAGPFEILQILDASVPNHFEALDVDLTLFQGTFQAVHDLVAPQIPPSAVAERCAWKSLNQELQDLIANSASEHLRAISRISS